MNPAVEIRDFASSEELFSVLRTDFESAVRPGDLVAVPTGNTPLPLYRSVRERPRPVWRELVYLLLDEYLDPPPQLERFSAYLDRELFDPLGVPPEQRVALPPELDAPEAAHYMDSQLDAHGPLEVVLLGLGHNGHIAFNEPSDHFAGGYHEVTLTAGTVARNLPEDPTRVLRALTISVPQILEARHIFLAVPQPEKQDLLAKALSSAPDPRLPVTALLSHSGTVIYRRASVSESPAQSR